MKFSKGKVDTSPLSEYYVLEIWRNSQSFKMKLENKHKFILPDRWKSKNVNISTKNTISREFPNFQFMNCKKVMGSI